MPAVADERQPIGDHPLDLRVGVEGRAVKPAPTLGLAARRAAAIRSTS
jgi:hypothetical protein